MELTTRRKIIIFLVYTLVAVAVGRYTVTFSSKDSKQDDKKEETHKKEDKDKHDDKIIKRKVVEETKPDGTKIKTTDTIVTDKKNETDHTNTDSKTDDKSKETKTETANSGKFNISVLGGVNVTNPVKPIFGAHVSRDIIGPVNVGLFGLSDGVVGASVGVTF